MQIKDVRPQSFVKQIRCDRCERLSELGEMEFEEYVSLDHKAGYASVFGDGNQVQIDLCQHCVKELLGQWLRIASAEKAGAPPKDWCTFLSSGAMASNMSDRLLERFDPECHGGEFPTSADVSPQKPDDMPL